MSDYDIAVLGGGPAGYVGAIKAARLGAKTVLIEKDEIGGTCLNRGCIPAKTLLKTAELIHEIRGAARRGVVIAGPPVSIDMAAALKEKNRVVKKLTTGVAGLLKANNIDILKGEGKLVSSLAPFKIAVQDAGDISAKSVLLAGGSKAAKPPIPGLDLPEILDSTEILDMEEIPPRLAIIGGGVIGVEMAMVFQAFGSKITIVEAMPRILPLMDGEIAALIHKTLKDRGAELFTGAGLLNVERDKKELKLRLANGKIIETDKALVSIGRTADLSALGEASAIKTEKGAVLVNEYMETSVPGIFAPGDINGKKMLAHAAFKMAETAAENAVRFLAGKACVKKAALDFISQVVYSFPEAASVGLSQEEAEKAGQVNVGKFPLAANGRALASGAAEGFVKVLSDPVYGKILGVHMVGMGASEIINEASSLMAMEITVHELAEIIHGHPTVCEALMEAAADALGRCVHLPPKSRI